MEVIQASPQRDQPSSGSKVDDAELANALRVLCMDQVQAANSGHPGAPLGLADVACVLWRRHLSFDPQNPNWLNRDRVVFSNGHCSALQYALLYLCGYDVTLDDLRQFRQLHSRSPGHPEYGVTPGVEATTGPLGQGLSNGVGLALAKRRMATLYNHDDCTLFDHRVYVFVGDGCLMEGISQEAISLAGHWGLGELIVLYDKNHISIDGDTEGWFAEDTGQRARACNWQVIDNIDGHDQAAVDRAITQAKNSSDKPSLLICTTRIGYGSPNKSGSADCHGSPLGVEEVVATRRQLGWQNQTAFQVPEALRDAWDQRVVGRQRYQRWQEKWLDYQTQYPQQAQVLSHAFLLQADEDQSNNRVERERDWQNRVAKAWQSMEQTLTLDQSLATRKMSGQILEMLQGEFPELIGGSGDLSGSTCVINQHSKAIHRGDFSGNFIHYGAREFAMVAIGNGLALYGAQLPFCASFLVFTDYARNAIRLCAMMKLRQIFIMTHDSIALGEDGPTHQPIEHLESLRLIPGLELWRPGNMREVMTAWRASMLYQGPSLLSLTRQSLAPIDNKEVDSEAIARGGYVLRDCENFTAIIVASGSELNLAWQLIDALPDRRLRLVSMPNRNTFFHQHQSWRDSVLPPECPQRVVIEAGSCGGWRAVSGDAGLFIGVEQFGCSAPASEVSRACQLTLDAIQQKTVEYLDHRAH